METVRGTAMEEWEQLIAETTAALRDLRVEYLQHLASRAQHMLDAPRFQPAKAVVLPQTVVRQHAFLGDLLGTTASNLQVLERAWNEETHSPWDR